jgi:tRNA(Ile2) C34 agmatinyltransferase TiaS
MSDDLTLTEGQIAVKCPHCGQMQATGSMKKKRCVYCGYTFPCKTTQVHGRQYKEE